MLMVKAWQLSIGGVWSRRLNCRARTAAWLSSRPPRLSMQPSA